MSEELPHDDYIIKGDMRFNRLICERLSEKIGRNVCTPEGASILQLDIETSTGERLGLNMVKRLVGVLPPVLSPRVSTLDAVAVYLGYRDWEMLELEYRGIGSGFGKPDPFVEMSELDAGSLVEICWQPRHRILINHDGNGQYEVIESENCKLLPGDLLSLSKLAMGFPFVADKVFRDEKPLGRYTAAEGTGITEFNLMAGADDGNLDEMDN